MSKITHSLLAFIALIAPSLTFSCTDFLISSKENDHVVGRSMEFAPILPIEITVVPREKSFQSKTSSGEPGLSWKNKYAYIGMVYPAANTVVDGFNEQGLSVGALWLPGTQYPNPRTNAPQTALFFTDVISWLLGSFSTVEEVNQAIAKANIHSGSVPGFSETPPIHLAIHDASGKSSVIEFIWKRIQISQNPIGVLTNAPEFAWHVTNLRNFINLSAMNSGQVNIDGTVLEPTGQGSGLLGIPGDWTPPSRFAKIAILKQAIETPKNGEAARLAAIHLLNTVDIPLGIIRSRGNEGSDFTQWIVIKDLTNKKLLYRTYNNQNIQGIDLLKENLEPGASGRIVKLDLSKP